MPGKIIIIIKISLCWRSEKHCQWTKPSMLSSLVFEGNTALLIYVLCVFLFYDGDFRNYRTLLLTLKVKAHCPLIMVYTSAVDSPYCFINIHLYMLKLPYLYSVMVFPVIVVKSLPDLNMPSLVYQNYFLHPTSLSASAFLLSIPEPI